MNNPKVILIIYTVVLLSSVGLAYTETSAVLDPLQEFAQQCDDAIGITVPKFNCDDGILVPTTNLTPANAAYPNGVCDRPNVLHGVCDRGSRFQVLPSNNPDAFAVAHCRKQGNDSGFYGDIAVIQHNQNNGATCFYQALGKLDGREVKAPLDNGVSSWIPAEPLSQSRWLSPREMIRADPCIACHDNGPIIRSPYLSQVTDPNDPNKKLLPGAGDASFNQNQPYFFIGRDFASWKAYKVEVPDNTCNVCHRLGVNNIRDGGTARDFGLIATADDCPAGGDHCQTHKNPHSPTSPIWMINVDTLKPNQPLFSQDNSDAATEIQKCASRFHGNPLAGTNCRITQFVPGMLNDALFFAPDPATYKTVMPEGCPAGFKGKFTFEGSMRVKDLTAEKLFSDLFIHVETLTGGNLMLLPTGEAKPAGAIFDPGISDLRVPGHPQEKVEFNICLKDEPFRSFELLVNVYGKENILE